MPNEPDPLEVAAALYLSISLFLLQLRRSPVQGELTLPEISALERLDRAGSATPGRRAAAEQITPQARGATLGELTRRGLAERRSDPADGRRVVVSLTEAGRRFVRNKRTARTEQLAKALSDRFTPAEIEVLGAAAPLIERLGRSL